MPKIQKAHVWALVIAFLSIPVLWALLFPVSNLIAEFISVLVGAASMDDFLIVDSVVSFVVLCVFIFVVLLAKKEHARFVVWFCAVSMFLYWGFESEFFWKGLNPMYPAWYEINMALNDVVAAALAIFIQSRITRSSTGRAPTAARAS
jgi:hypothetical protein